MCTSRSIRVYAILSKQQNATLYHCSSISHAASWYVYLPVVQLLSTLVLSLLYHLCFHRIKVKVKVKINWSRYRPGVAQRVGRGIALLFHDRGTRRGWVVNSTPQPNFTPGKGPVPILMEAGWAPGPVWTGGKSRRHRDSILDRPARSQSLYRLSYPAHCVYII